MFKPAPISTPKPSYKPTPSQTTRPAEHHDSTIHASSTTNTQQAKAPAASTHASSASHAVPQPSAGDQILDAVKNYALFQMVFGSHQSHAAPSTQQTDPVIDPVAKLPDLNCDDPEQRTGAVRNYDVCQAEASKRIAAKAAAGQQVVNGGYPIPTTKRGTSADF